MTETQRINKLIGYEILDSKEDSHLNSITNLVSILCNVPICLISFIDKNRQWFMSKVGLNICETKRNIAFCDYTIKNYEIFEISDTFLDLRFIDNPLVKGDPFIRFYAGMPLTCSEGYNIGTLCILDTKPRNLDNKERLILSTFARDIINHIELKVFNSIKKKEKENFLNEVCHELRTPLNAMYGFTQLLIETKMDDKQEEYVNIIKTSIENMIILINKFLDINKLENGKMKQEKYLFDIHNNMKNIYNLFYHDAEKKGIIFNMNIDKKIPTQLFGDGIRLNQILINLISNAIKFTNNGSVHCNLTLSEQNEIYNTILFSVKDTGIGIPYNRINDLFLRYEQLHENNFKNFGGSGLGLNITNNLVKLLGSHLDVNSIYGEGSEFYFKINFPKNKDNLKSNNINNLKLKDKKVLLCEDSEFNIRLIKNIIEKFGMKIEYALNGKMGIEKLKNGDYDFILMDLNMPELNGYETTEYIRKKLNLSTPIIAITANSSDIEKEKCLTKEMNGFLSKPFKYDDLYNIFCDLVNKRYKDKYQKFFKSNKIQIKYKIIDNCDNIKEVNINILKSFTGNDMELEKELINKFIIEFPKYIRRLQYELKNYNYKEMKSIAHKLKSFVKMFGFNDLYVSLSEIEKFCNLKNINKICKECSKIVRISDIILNQLKDILKEVYSNDSIVS